MSANPTSTNPNTLGLDDEMDDVEILEELERAFDVKFTDEDARPIFQVGQLYDVLQAKLGPATGEKCASAMAFYRLRRAISQHNPTVSVSPATQLTDICLRNPKSAFRKLEEQSGLKVPELLTGPRGVAGILLVAVALSAFLFGHLLLHRLGFTATDSNWVRFLTGIGCLSLGGVLIWSDPMKLPARLNTFGELATTTAALNYGLLTKSGARHRPEELWDALTEVLSSSRDTLAPQEIHKVTYILQVTFDEARKNGTLREG